MVERPAGSSRHPLHESTLPKEFVVLTDGAREELEQYRRTHETLVLTIYFSDLVGSTRLQTELGNLRAAELVQRHYLLMRQVLGSFDGREIKTVGDSMLIVFAAPSEAVKFALHVERAMRQERQAKPGTPRMRAGVHLGQVVLEMDRCGAEVVDVYGLQVSTAARIMDLSQGEQILLSRAVFDDARAILSTEDFPDFLPLAWRNHGPYRFKGVEDSRDIYSLGLTLYQIAVGDLDRPLTGDWETQLFSEVLRDDIHRCVRQDPADRWPRAAPLAQALRSHDQRVLTQALERQREEHRIRARHFRRAAVLASLAAAVLLAISGFAAVQWQEAARQRDRAVAQKRLALQAINQLTHDVPARLRSVPGTLPAVRAILEENMAMLDQILALEPDTHFARRERAVNLMSIGDRWLLVGDTQRSLASYQEGLRIASELAETHPDIPAYLRDVAMAWDRLGDVRDAMGQSEEALDAYNKSMDITRVLVQRTPTDRNARRDVWLALDKLGRIGLKLGRSEQAAKHYADN